MDALKKSRTLGDFIQQLQSEFNIRLKESETESADVSGRIYRPRSLIRLLPPAGKIVVPLRMNDDELLDPAMVVFFCKRLRISPTHFDVFVQ